MIPLSEESDYFCHCFSLKRIIIKALYYVSETYKEHMYDEQNRMKNMCLPGKPFDILK